MQCTECEAQVSVRATECPSCKATLRQDFPGWLLVLPVVFLLLILGLLIAAFFVR